MDSKKEYVYKKLKKQALLRNQLKISKESLNKNMYDVIVLAKKVKYRGS